jgi:hypothetical protein
MLLFPWSWAEVPKAARARQTRVISLASAVDLLPCRLASLAPGGFLAAAAVSPRPMADRSCRSQTLSGGAAGGFDRQDWHGIPGAPHTASCPLSMADRDGSRRRTGCLCSAGRSRGDLVLFVSAAHDDPKSRVRQRPLQRPRLIPRRTHPHVPLLLSGQDHWHRLGMDRRDDGVRSGGESALDHVWARRSAVAGAIGGLLGRNSASWGPIRDEPVFLENVPAENRFRGRTPTEAALLRRP